MLQKKITRYFPVPKYLDIPSVGVDISPFAVRFMEIIPEKEHFRVGRFEHVRLQKVFTLADESSLLEVRNILKAWKKKHNLHYVEVSLPEEKAYLFKMDIPFGSHKEMRSAVEFNLEENVPISGSEAIFDFRIIYQNQNKTVSVAVTVLPIDIVNKYLMLFESAGLTPVSFLIEPQALSKAIIPKDDQGTYFIINIGESKTGLFVVSEGSVQFTSTLALGGQNFTDALMKAFNITKEEAEDIKKNKNELLGSLINTASAFREEIEKIYIYWNTHQEKKNEVGVAALSKKIILTGKDALMSGFKEYISQSLKVETEIGNVWVNVASFDDYIPPIPAHEALDFGRAIGLALPKIN